MALPVLAVLDLVHVLFAVAHDLPFCPERSSHAVLGGSCCSSFVSVSLVFGVGQLLVVLASFVFMAIARVRVVVGALVNAVPVAVLVLVAYLFSQEGLDIRGVEDAEHLVGSAGDVFRVDALLGSLLVGVCVLGVLVLRKGRAARAGSVS